MRSIFKGIALTCCICILFTSCQTEKKEKGNRPNLYVGTVKATRNETGLTWPEGQAIPTFAETEKTLDAIDINSFSNAEKIFITALQGIVNRTKPRIFLIRSEAEEGPRTWVEEELGYELNLYRRKNWLEAVQKYLPEVKGCVIYDSKNPESYNLALTVAGLKDALPVDDRLFDKMKENGIELEVLEDIRDKFTTKTEAYQYLYDNYWKDCNHKILVNLGNDTFPFIKDLAVAAKCAVVYFNPLIEEEAELLDKFLSDMKAGEGIVMGWWPDEHSGISAAGRKGIQVVPSDFFDNLTVFAGMSRELEIPEVPKVEPLENKIYITIFLSDGDNLQYMQHSMYNAWQDSGRGSAPINWTVSPILYDAAPQMFNYYMKTATDNDCFSAGPSGAGYSTMENWSMEDLEAYTKQTERYLQQTGIRLTTIWSYVNQETGDIYAKNCRTLLGASVQDWDGSTEYMTFENRVAFTPNSPGYAHKIEDIYNEIYPLIKDYDGTAPEFFSVQGVSWEMRASQVEKLIQMFEEVLPGKIEIVRGDHFYELYKQANSLPYNLCFSQATKAESSEKSSEKDALLTDGSPSKNHIWEAEQAGEQVFTFDFGEEKEINRYVIYHAEKAGYEQKLNTKDFKLEASTDGKSWTEVDVYTGNTAEVTDIEIDAVKARYMRLTVTNGGEDGIVRIGDIEFYGNKQLTKDGSIVTEPKNRENYKVVSIPKMSGTPEIDGSISAGEWDSAFCMEVNSETFVTEYKGFQLKARIPENFSSGNAYIAWSEEGLYVAAKIQDPDLYFGDFNEPGEIDSESCDSFHLSVDPLNKNTFGNKDAYLFSMLAGNKEGVDGEASWCEAWKYKTADASAGVIYNASITDTGYEMEMFIPYKALQKNGEEQIKPQVGTKIGFGFTISDVDKDGNLKNRISSYGGGQGSTSKLLENAAQFMTGKFV